jgi:quercetin 2,3-dioxygenase
MTNLDSNPGFESDLSNNLASQILHPRKVKLTTRAGISVERLLPNKDVRMIGAWCFLDHFLPDEHNQKMQVAAHPHTGLQTVTWLFSGEVIHNDSLGRRQKIRPTQLNLMTAGIGISHSEVSTNESEMLHGIQFWIALPDAFRSGPATFQHYENLPFIDMGSVKATLIAGELFDKKSPTQIYSPLVGAQLDFGQADEIEIEIREDFEYGFLAVNSNIFINEDQTLRGSLFHLSKGNGKVKIKSDAPAIVIMIGGVPFEEEILMWWNFIGRNHDEIERMRINWETSSELFGFVTDDLGERIPAPPLPNIKLQPRKSKR